MSGRAVKSNEVEMRDQLKRFPPKCIPNEDKEAGMTKL
jgi:hypothetical protein